MKGGTEERLQSQAAVMLQVEDSTPNRVLAPVMKTNQQLLFSFY